MTPAARLAAAAEVLDRVRTGGAPAGDVLRAWGSANRYAGSKDRRAVAERVYLCLRQRPRLAWAAGREEGRGLVLFSLALIDGLDLAEIERLFSGEGYGPAPLTEAERTRLAALPGEPTASVLAGLPPFVSEDLRTQFGEDCAAEAEALLLPRAPVDLRVNGAAASCGQVAGELRAVGLDPGPTPWSAWGLRLPAEPPPDLAKLVAFRAGRVEVQDEGSQIAAWLGGTGELIVDYCAGGGGKTLALRQAAPAARLIACDVQVSRLDAIRPRLVRAGARAELRRLGSQGEGTDDLLGRADLVFVDAPCSGSGAWRRRPEAAWRLTPEEVERLHALQLAILARAARLVRPGGRLQYVTCSVLGRENGDVASAFAEAHPEFRPAPIAEALATPNLSDAARLRLAELAGGGHTLQLTPARTGTDGFFVVAFQRTA